MEGRRVAGTGVRVVGIWLQEMFQKLNGWFLNATLLGFDFCAMSVVFLFIFFSSKTFNFFETHQLGRLR